MGEKDYINFTKNRPQKKVNVVYREINSTKFIDKRFKFSGNVLDFGSAIESPNYEKTVRDGGKYCGFDIDNETIGWLKKKGFFEDFWNTKKKFNTIVASQSYEHLDLRTREKFVEKSFQILKSPGTLILEYPHIKNLGGMQYWHDKYHQHPPAVEDEGTLLELKGFKAEVHLVGLSVWPPYYSFRLLLNVLLGFRPQHNVVIVGRKS